jgi:hypothetical protein
MAPLASCQDDMAARVLAGRHIRVRAAIVPGEAVAESAKHHLSRAHAAAKACEEAVTRRLPA